MMNKRSIIFLTTLLISIIIGIVAVGIPLILKNSQKLFYKFDYSLNDMEIINENSFALKSDNSTIEYSINNYVQNVEITLFGFTSEEIETAARLVVEADGETLYDSDNAIKNIWLSHNFEIPRRININKNVNILKVTIFGGEQYFSKR